ncbi:hypothetical protein [Vibrio gallaecicus]|uniref:DUF4230 domain-containing protein n=1 Tax=Vibrio gallaecicus TaxID=552386 RepID=A0ABV4NHK1_9VIBR
MERLILVVAIILLAGASSWLWFENHNLNKQVEDEIEKSKISVSATMLSKATEFTFMKVTANYTYHMKQKDLGPRKGNWEAIYTWDYPFNFGYKIEDEWNWCIKVNEEERTVSINAPQIKQLNESAASPKVEAIFNGGVRSTQIAAQEWIVVLANKKVKEAAEAYLDNQTVKESVKQALASFFRGILNDARKGMKPINEVIVNIKDDDVCIN